jgi:gamma-glutamylputrescine oxidase
MHSRYIDYYYAQTANPAPERAALQGDIETEVCVIGGGLAGLNAALGLLERGRSAVVVEAERIAWGASGRNGGFVGRGYAGGPEALIKRVGAAQARKLLDLTVEAVDLIRRRITENQIACSPVASGMLRAWWTDNADEARRASEHVQETLGIGVEFWPREKLRETLVSKRYFDALYYPNNFHFHPLNYALGIAGMIENKGGRIFESSRVTRLELDGPVKFVHSAGGRIKAGKVIVACGGYIDGLHRKLSGALRPVATYVMVTEPLGDRLRTAIRGNHSVIDSRYDFDYYRPLLDTRIMWGGGITIRRSDPPNLRQMMLKKLLTVYPQLEGVRVESAWTGLMGYPRHKMPQIGEVSPGVWYTMGFGGHGMGTTTVTGELVAAAIAEGDDRYKMFAPFGLDWTGGVLGLGVVELIYRYYRFRDWLRS